MAHTTEEVIAGLAELINEETGISADQVSMENPSPRTSTSTPFR